MKILKLPGIFMVIPMLFLAACSGQLQDQDQSALTNTSTMQISQKTQQATSAQLEAPKTGEQIAIIETDLGVIKFKLFSQDVPELTKNFKYLAKEGKYNDVPFHRVVKNFMIQTGDFTNKNGTGGYSYKGPNQYLANEINPAYRHLYGTVSMAKTSAPVSIGSQFFIVTNKQGAPFLNGNYSPIGQVYKGMEVAETIADLQVPGTETPSKLINMKKVTFANYK